MPNRPQAVANLDRMLEAIRVGHEAISDLHHSLAALGQADASAPLLRESAEMTLQRAAQVSAAARLLARRWTEESVLAPERAELTASRLTDEVGRIEPELRSMLARQVEIARELRGRLLRSDR